MTITSIPSKYEEKTHIPVPKSQYDDIPLISDEEWDEINDNLATNFDAQQRLIEAYSRYAKKLAMWYSDREVPIDDIIQEAILELIIRIREGKYNPNLASINAYIKPWIINAIQQCLKNNHRQRNISTVRSRTIAKLWHVTEAKINEGNEAYTEQELARRLGYKARNKQDMDKLKITRLGGSSRRVPIDSCSHNNNPQVILEINEERQKIHNAITYLDNKSQVVVKGIFFGDMTENNLAEELNLSRSMIGQIKKQALEKLNILINAKDMKETSEKLQLKSPRLMLAQSIRREMISLSRNKQKEEILSIDDDNYSLNKLLLLALSEFDSLLDCEEQRVIRKYYLENDENKPISMKSISKKYKTTERKLHTIRKRAITKFANAISNAYTIAT